MNSPIDPPIARSRPREVVDSNATSLARFRAVYGRAQLEMVRRSCPFVPPKMCPPQTGQRDACFGREHARVKPPARAHPLERTGPVHPRARNGPSDELATRGWSEMPSAHRPGTLRIGASERPFEGDPVRLSRSNSGSAVPTPARFTTCVATPARRARAPRFFLLRLTSIPPAKNSQGARAGGPACRAKPMHHGPQEEEEPAQAPARVPR